MIAHNRTTTVPQLSHNCPTTVPQLSRICPTTVPQLDHIYKFMSIFHRIHDYFIHLRKSGDR